MESSISSSDAQGTDDRLEAVIDIPTDISDSELAQYCSSMELELEPGCTFVVYRGEGYITFCIEPNLLEPGSKFTPITVPFPKNKRAEDRWTQVEAAIHVGKIACNRNLAGSWVSIAPTPLLKHQEFEKATHFLQLLFTSLVPLSMAIEIFLGVRQEEIIKIGFQEGGPCSKFQINEVDYLKRWECLYCSLEALTEATGCHIFLNENTFTAVTTVGSQVERIPKGKVIVEDCITKDVCPALTSITDDLHANHAGSFQGGLKKGEMPQYWLLYTSLEKKRVSKLQESLRMIKSFLINFDILCTPDKNSMVFSTRMNPEPDIVDKAWQILELLSTTHVPAPMVVTDPLIQWRTQEIYTTGKTLKK